MYFGILGLHTSTLEILYLYTFFGPNVFYLGVGRAGGGGGGKSLTGLYTTLNKLINA